MDMTSNKLVLYFKKKAVSLLVGLGVMLTFLLASSGHFVIPGMDLLERELYDAKIRLTATDAQDSNVVILDIDEKSLGEFGRWPWSRTLIAKINDQLFDQEKISALGYDVVWAEKDNLNPKSILEKLNLSLIDKSPQYADFLADIRKMDSDQVFANSLKERAVVLGYYLNNESDGVTANVLPTPVLTQKELPSAANKITSWRAYTGNLPDLTAAAAAGGYFNPIVDDDGVIRRMPLLAQYGGQYYQSLSLGLVRLALGSMPIEPSIVGTKNEDYYQLEALTIGPLTIPVAADATAFVPYHGKAHSFQYYSVSDLLNHKIKPGALEGKIVIMGSSAPGLRDQRATPIDSVFPGVEIHASMVDGILQDQIKQKPAFAMALVLIEVLVFGLMLLLILPALDVVWSVILTLISLSIVTGIDLYFWSKLNLVIPVAPVVVTVILIFVFNTLIGYLTEGRLKKNMASLFGEYVPPELVKKMSEDPLKYSMEGKDAVLSVLFSDVRGFTGISEQLTAPQLSAYINEYLSTMSAVITEELGTLDKYIGDAIMAFWGAPLDNERHAFYSVKAALRMSEETVRLADSFAMRGLPPFNIGIGVNAGPMRVGDMGSKYRRAYTVMGDPVNLASRLEGLTKQYGLTVLVGSSIVELAPEFYYQEIDRVRVKGKNDVVTIYTPICLKEALTPSLKSEVEAWSHALAYYFDGEWDRFIEALNELRRVYGHKKLYEIYLERAETFKKTPPPADWGGVYTHTEK